MVNIPGQILPADLIFRECHVPMRTPLFRDGHRARVQIQVIIPKRFPRRDMCMSMEQDIPFLQRRQAFQIEIVAVGGVDHVFFHIEDAVVRQDGELQDHLVHFRIAVAPHAEDLLFSLI